MLVQRDAPYHSNWADLGGFLCGLLPAVLFLPCPSDTRWQSLCSALLCMLPGMQWSCVMVRMVLVKSGQVGRCRKTALVASYLSCSGGSPNAMCKPPLMVMSLMHAGGPQQRSCCLEQSGAACCAAAAVTAAGRSAQRLLRWRSLT